jgi:plasmid stabilization system protein ParE
VGARPLRVCAQFPELGRVVPEVGRAEIREIIFRGYRVVYRVAPRLVEVLTVRHGKRKFSFREVGISKAR